MVRQELQAEAVRLLVLLRAMYASRSQHHRTATPARCTRCGGSLTIASALGHRKELIPDDVSTRGDVDACSRASRADENIIKIRSIVIVKGVI